MKQNNRKQSPSFGFLIILLFILVCLVGLIIWQVVPMLAQDQFGAASDFLTPSQKWSYGLQLILNRDKLLNPLCTASGKVDVNIPMGDSIASLSARLESKQLIPDADLFRAYLIFKGLDTQIRAGDYQIDCTNSPIQIANLIKNNYLEEVVFNILPGWRAEEIAAALPTSGIEVSAEDFLKVVRQPDQILLPDYIPAGSSVEGFLFPGEYTIKRSITAQGLVQLFIDRFSQQVTPEIVQSAENHGLTFYQAVIMASIVQRETFAESERPMMASVFYNRLTAGMNLETDPTVQYALGYDTAWGWWKSPLSESDLQVQSAYNTYLNNGLPPAPISNPDLSSINAVANPAVSTYFYFRAKCDNSGLHVFAQTFEEHVANACK